MRALVGSVLVAALCSCGQVEHHSKAQVSVHDQRQAALDRIADKCRLSRSTFTLVGNNELHFKPSSDARYESVDCGLKELRKANLPVNLGFVGNEYYDRNEQ